MEIKEKKILIVDDSAFMRKVLRDVFESAGYMNFIEASNGHEAIEKFKNEHPDFILLDLIMPRSEERRVGKECRL